MCDEFFVTDVSTRDMLLFRKSRVWGCYKPRHVTKRDVLVLALYGKLKEEESLPFGPTGAADSL